MTCRESAPWPLESGADTVLDGLTRYDPQWLALHNRLHRHREIWQGVCGGQPVTVQWSSVTPVGEPLRDVHLTLGDAALLLQLPTTALTALNLAEPVTHGLAGAMLLELALLGFIEPLERLTGQTLRVVEAPEVAECEPFVVHLTLSVALADGEPMAIPLHLSATATQWLVEHLEQHLTPVRHELGALAFLLEAQAGEALLSVAELRSLRPGDIVMLDDWPAGQIRLTLDERLHARAELTGHTATLLEPPMVVISLKEPCMTDSAVTSDLDSSLDELMLKMVCQVGSVELSIAQLRELGVGSVLQLTPQWQEGVDLMVNGRRIGQGQLVKVGDGLGVRLLSLVTP
jgi:type III secretion protein Q